VSKSGSYGSENSGTVMYTGGKLSDWIGKYLFYSI
jgi:hypothetical protein